LTFRTPGFGRRFGLGGRARILVPALVVLAVLIAAFLIFTETWTDLLWYRSLGYSSVYTTELWTRAGLFAGAGLLMAVVVGANMTIAYRLRPVDRLQSTEQQGLERYRAVIDPHRRLITVGLLLLLGLLTGASAAGQWRVWLAFMNRTDFGIKDPQFHKDLSFYVFTYPFVRMLLGYLFATVILSTVVSVVVHYVYAGLRLQGPGAKASPSARAHLSVLIGVFVLLKAVAYWFDRWGLAGSERGVVTGPSYTDVNAVLPAKTILAVIAVICAILFFVNIVRRGMTLPGVGFVLLVLSAVLVGGVYPLLIQQFQVAPNEKAKERVYIARNIKATRDAYDVANVQVTQRYSARTTPQPADLSREAATIAGGVRLLDPSVVSPTFAQLQQKKNFYTFPDQLDVDRYPLTTPTDPATAQGVSTQGVSTQDTVVAVRGLTGAPPGRQNWVNDHLVYTHGYGFVAAYGSQVAGNGEPDFVEKDMPPRGQLGRVQPRIYFGEQTPDYSIVGAPSGKAAQELDYPDDNASSSQKNTTYTGGGGVSVGSFFRRLLYSVKFGDKDILLSGSVNRDSRILYTRDPRTRVQKVAPWLTLDGDQYPAVVGGHIVWIVDGYTTTGDYPYSEKMSFGDATSDTITDTRNAVAKQNDDQINYIRNAVKATVDAYTGKVTLYAWDEKDPILRTWEKAFPGVVKPKKDISPDLMAHLRYPQDLFKVQRQILSRYHVTDPGGFYDGQDFWQVPRDPVNSSQTQPAYYQTLRMPGDVNAQFSLSSTFTPKERANLAAFMAVDAVPGSPGYGRIRILSLSSNSTLPGPGQVQNNFENDPAVSSVLSLLRQNGSRVVSGNLLALPFGGGFLYVEPVYVEASSGEAFPLLKKVLVSFGNSIGFDDTFAKALGEALSGTAPAGPPPNANLPTGTLSQDVKNAIQNAESAFNAGQQALKRGDWAAYGTDQQNLQKALSQLAAAIKQQESKKPTH
jgi:uncharacterized membrane protein (UPF0182 family)